MAQKYLYLSEKEKTETSIHLQENYISLGKGTYSEKKKKELRAIVNVLPANSGWAKFHREGLGKKKARGGRSQPDNRRRSFLRERGGAFQSVS